MADKVKGMSPKQVQFLMKAAVTANKAAQGIRKVKNALAGSWMLWLALAVLILAILLRYYGFM